MSNAFSRPPNLPAEDDLTNRDIGTTGHLRAGMILATVSAASLGGAALVSRRLRLATMAQQQRRAQATYSLATKLTERLAAAAGTATGRMVGVGLGATMGGMGGPVGMLAGAYIGHHAAPIAGQKLAGLAVRAKSLQGSAAAAALGRGIKIGAGGVVAGGIALGLSLLGERDPEPGRADVANPRSSPLGTTIDGHAARRRQREHELWMRGGGIAATIARGAVGMVVGLSDLVHSGIPLTIGPGARRRAEVRLGELTADRRVADAQANQARMSNMGISAVSGNRAPLADRGSTSLHLMGIRRADQVAQDARFEEFRQQKRLEGGIL